ncbi:4-hydroxythreonine-4-phosphate dehydrogenase [Campylobacter sp.]|uniref:4-hydroxythreonine-4-phosphate dehydrogenase n=1 Tax=Campylobacter sp. TaxID=205 RepID=UPI0026FFB317|nr:4-hydroxythreonine-4-phosphate dehydrogenase [Campylobacter sp.]
MHKIAVSVGDINGVGIEIALKAHDEICKFAKPIYCINENLLNRALGILKVQSPANFNLHECGENFEILPANISEQSGKFSFESFEAAINLAVLKEVDAIVTMPISKEAWSKAGINFVGHTDYLKAKFKQDAIMMLGCDELFVALYTDHIALKDLFSEIKADKICKFLLNLYKNTKFERIGVLGVNPHASDNGVLGGDEEKQIKKAINLANKELQKDIFVGPLVPDAAFTPRSLKRLNRLVAIYHDQGLAPLKALYFDKSINVSLNLPVIRTSVDHGTAFDIAYKGLADISSYIEAVKFAVKLCEKRSL